MLAVAAVEFSSAARAQPSNPAPEVAKAVENLRLAARQLNETVNVFNMHVDQAIARFDRGYRIDRNKQIQGADSGLGDGQADVMQAAVHKLFLARMIASRSEDYQPAPLADLDRLEQLIRQARRSIEDGDALARKLMLASVKELGDEKIAAWKQRQDQVRGARIAAQEAIKRALLALPLDFPEGGSLEEKKDKAWDLLAGGQRVPQTVDEQRQEDSVPKPDPVPLFPLRLTKNTRITVVSEPSYRMALTDPEIEYADGMRIFYEEEWVQRGAVVVRMRWRVGVDKRTGQHILLKRYRLLERRGDLAALYRGWDPDYVWYLEPAEDSTEPTRPELESALAHVASAQQRIHDALEDYKLEIRQEVERNNRIRAEANQAAVDGGLPESLREKLFAIRGHLARVKAILNLEHTVRQAIDGSFGSVHQLEALAAWGNLDPPSGAPYANLSVTEWEAFQERSAAAIDLLHAARLAARDFLPPEMAEVNAEFPAMQKDLVVHIFSPVSPLAGSSVRYMQEIWGWEYSLVGGERLVRRIATLIQIDPRTGDQIQIAGGTTHYKAVSGDTVEEIYEQNAGQDIPLAAANSDPR
jgi:hypothetical protein